MVTPLWERSDLICQTGAKRKPTFLEAYAGPRRRMLGATQRIDVGAIDAYRESSVVPLL